MEHYFLSAFLPSVSACAPQHPIDHAMHLCTYQILSILCRLIDHSQISAIAIQSLHRIFSLCPFFISVFTSIARPPSILPATVLNSCHDTVCPLFQLLSSSNQKTHPTLRAYRRCLSVRLTRGTSACNIPSPLKRISIFGALIPCTGENTG